jgi:hypothetical protein
MIPNAPILSPIADQVALLTARVHELTVANEDLDTRVRAAEAAARSMAPCHARTLMSSQLLCTACMVCFSFRCPVARQSRHGCAFPACDVQAVAVRRHRKGKGSQPRKVQGMRTRM